MKDARKTVVNSLFGEVLGKLHALDKFIRRNTVVHTFSGLVVAKKFNNLFSS